MLLVYIFGLFFTLIVVGYENEKSKDKVGVGILVFAALIWPVSWVWVLFLKFIKFGNFIGREL